MPKTLYRALAVTGRGVAIVAMMIGGWLAYGALAGTVVNELPADAVVLADHETGLYATLNCVLTGKVSARYLVNPEDIADQTKPLQIAPLTEAVRHEDARRARDVRGNRMRRDPQCNGFYIDARPAWRALIGW